MRNSKLVASAVVSAFLLPSLWTALPMNARYAGWYWPFLDYPMYSRAHYVGETTSTHELRLRSCAPADSVTVADYRELGLHNLRFWDLMREAAGDGAGATAAQDQLTAVIRGRKATSFCETELWERRFVLGEQGIADRNPSPRLVRRWRLDDQSRGTK